jgi:D-3-phosphoglycerate dehydrogenase / 2-oxoglutarate reductase
MIRMLCPEPDSFSKKGLDYASKNINLTCRALTQQQFEEIAPNYEVLLIRFNTIISESILIGNSKIKSIISPTTGLDHIDLVAVKCNKVKVYHLKGQKRFLKGVSGTAELTIGLMLSLLRKIPQSFESVKKCEWETGPFRGNEVSEKKIGIIGCGRLGSKVSRVAVALGMNVFSYDPYISRFPTSVTQVNSLADLLSMVDILTVHIPLLPKTRHLISKKEIDQMKDGVVIINTSRGSIISTQALLYGLEKGKIKSAAIDVMEDEHCIKKIGHVLIDYANKHDNLLITPHIGGATYESVEKTDFFILKKYFSEVE